MLVAVKLPDVLPLPSALVMVRFALVICNPAFSLFDVSVLLPSSFIVTLPLPVISKGGALELVILTPESVIVTSSFVVTFIVSDVDE